MNGVPILKAAFDTDRKNFKHFSFDTLTTFLETKNSPFSDDQVKEFIKARENCYFCARLS